VDYTPLDLDGGNECTPSCKGKCCGPDGCGGTCPDICPSSHKCDTGTCECSGTCGCTSDEDCWAGGCCRDCICMDMNCNGLECGPDPVCGYSCGYCQSCQQCVNGRCGYGAICQTDSECMSTQCCRAGCCEEMACGPLECGPDPVCGWECGPCSPDKECVNGSCVFVGSELGDPCPLGNVNLTAENCAPGLSCLGFPADGQAGTCPGGNPTECIDIPANANPDCVNGNCGASFCAEQCDAQGPQGHCPAGFVCQDVGDTWFCVPA